MMISNLLLEKVLVKRSWLKARGRGSRASEFSYCDTFFNDQFLKLFYLLQGLSKNVSTITKRKLIYIWPFTVGENTKIVCMSISFNNCINLKLYIDIYICIFSPPPSPLLSVEPTKESGTVVFWIKSKNIWWVRFQIPSSFSFM